MHKKKFLPYIAVCIVLFLSACQSSYDKFECEFGGMFDTNISIVGFAHSKREFTKQAYIIRDRLEYLSQLYDIYTDYDGLNNLKTINDNAGVKPVVVKPEIIALLKVCKDAYATTDGKVNVAMGSVLSIWHDYRTNGNYNPKKATLPPMDMLNAAAQHTDIQNVIIDENASTVFLADKEMSLDVGAIAKGYATELVRKEAVRSGFTSGIINVGGNIVTIGKPLDGVHDNWGIGVKDPSQQDDTQTILGTVYISDMAAVSSGDYQRYYIVDNKIYHHIIDPDTHMPADYYKSVTVLHKDSGVADMLSTALFIMPFEEGERLLKAEGGDALWVLHDGTEKMTDGFRHALNTPK